MCVQITRKQKKGLIADFEELDIKIQGSIGRDDASSASCSVPKLRRNDETSPTADVHAGDAHVPALDDGARVVLVAAREARCMVDGERAAKGKMEKSAT